LKKYEKTIDGAFRVQYMLWPELVLTFGAYFNTNSICPASTRCKSVYQVGKRINTEHNEFFDFILI